MAIVTQLVTRLACRCLLDVAGTVAAVLRVPPVRPPSQPICRMLRKDGLKRGVSEASEDAYEAHPPRRANQSKGTSHACSCKGRDGVRHAGRPVLSMMSHPTSQVESTRGLTRQYESAWEQIVPWLSKQVNSETDSATAVC